MNTQTHTTAQQPEEIQNWLIERLQEAGVSIDNDVDQQAKLLDLGVSSLHAVTLQYHIQEHYAAFVELDKLLGAATINSLSIHILESES